MDYPMHADRLSRELSILYFKGFQVEISKLWCISVVKICFYLCKTVHTLTKCHAMQDLIGVFTVCKSACLQVYRMKKVKKAISHLRMWKETIGPERVGVYIIIYYFQIQSF